MINIPEGTQFIESGCGNKGFRKYEKGQWWFFEGFWRVVDWKMGDLTPVADHPDYSTQVTQWDGEGVPPIGIEFEYTTNAGYNWHKGRLLFLDSQVVLLHGYQLFKIDDPDLGFRPLRTPEQIAAEEREKAINELTAGYAPHTEILRKWAERAYDELGYRKQEAS